MKLINGDCLDSKLLINLKLIKDNIEIEIEIKEIGFTLKTSIKNSENFIMPFIFTDVDLLNQITKEVNECIDYTINRNKIK